MLHSLTYMDEIMGKKRSKRRDRDLDVNTSRFAATIAEMS
jgi:hypothetical protein